jgi:hypothetical protein
MSLQQETPYLTGFEATNRVRHLVVGTMERDR